MPIHRQDLKKQQSTVESKNRKQKIRKLVQLNSASKDKKIFQPKQCKEIENNN